MILKVIEEVPDGRKLQITARKQGGLVEIEFGVAGLIVSEENLAEIFNPLRRGPSTSLRTSPWSSGPRTEGSGQALLSAGGTILGMAVSKRLVEGVWRHHRDKKPGTALRQAPS